ncbi:hypothetical protein C1893_30645 [Pseudomonas sp. MPR-ANC1]|nr:hypothetical protein C1893_30645 [Pseudomonas sp. MPR-ANC1]
MNRLSFSNIQRRHCKTQSLVGAGLLAKARGQATFFLTEIPHSRAGSLSQVRMSTAQPRDLRSNLDAQSLSFGDAMFFAKD